MRIFLTGATGFIGSHIVPELIGAGHRVLGLTRSDAGAKALETAGAEPHRGDITDLDSLRSAASRCDAVIHTAFDHDFSNFLANCEKDKRVIHALGGVLAGSDRPLLITSGTGLGNPSDGGPAIEDIFNTNHANPRIASEYAGIAMLEAGVNVSVMRLPQVHDTVKQGLITPLIVLSREKAVSAYLGEGQNCWSAAHVTDVARAYRLAIEAGKKGARYHAVAESRVTMRDVAEAVGAGLGVPVVSLTAEEAPAHFGWLAMFAGMDLKASSAQTRSMLDWEPTGPGLIDDLKRVDYAAVAAW